MLEKTYLQYAIVEGDSASLLSDKLNEKLRELKDKEPKVTFDGLTARIAYTERIEIPEDLSEAYSMNKVTLTCSRCPFFEPIEKQDGTIDKRRKRGKCPAAKYGIAFSDGPACETLFQMLNDGGVELCFAKSEQD